MKIELEVNDALSGITGMDTESLKKMFFGDLKEGEEPKLKDGVNPVSVISELVAAKMKADRDNQYGRAIKETNTKYESFLVESGYKGTKQGVDALADFLASRPKPEPGKGGDKAEITPEFLESDPIARKWLEDKIEPIKKVESDLKKQLADKDNQFKQDRKDQLLEARAIEHLDSKKWDDGGEKNRKKRIAQIVKLLKLEEIELSEDGKTLIVMENGYPKKDNLSNPVTFEALVEATNTHDYLQYDKKDDPGSKGKPGQGSGSGGLKITSNEQYNKLRREASIKYSNMAERTAEFAKINAAFDEYKATLTE